MRRVWMIVAVALCAALFFGFGLHRYLSLDSLKANYAALQAAYAAHPVLFITGFIAFQATALALCIPGSLVIMALAAGALFGTVAGSAIVLVAVVTGDSLSFLLARYLLRDWVRRRFADRYERIERGFERHGAFYLLALRMMAIIPFFVVNLSMGLTRMRLRVFAPVSFVGLIPSVAIHVNIGTELRRIQSLSDIVSWQIILSFALLGLAPILIRLLFSRWLGDQPASADAPTAIAPIGPAIAPRPGAPTSASMSSADSEP